MPVRRGLTWRRGREKMPRGVRHADVGYSNLHGTVDRQSVSSLDAISQELGRTRVAWLNRRGAAERL